MKKSICMLILLASATVSQANSITNLAATAITSTGATIRASCAASAPGYARLYWGLSDAGTNGWTHTNANITVGESTVALTNYLSGLIRTNVYYYRWSIDGVGPGAEPVWAASSTNFSTLMTPGIPTGFPTIASMPVTCDTNGTLRWPLDFFARNYSPSVSCSTNVGSNTNILIVTDGSPAYINGTYVMTNNEGVWHQFAPTNFACFMGNTGAPDNLWYLQYGPGGGDAYLDTYLTGQWAGGGEPFVSYGDVYTNSVPHFALPLPASAGEAVSGGIYTNSEGALYVKP